MQKQDETAALDARQQHVAESGLKVMMPIGRPFLDYAISALADAGITDICLVIGASGDHERMRDYYGSLETSRVRIAFATQERPRGTADAVLAGESFADGEHVLMVNGDNYYPIAALRALSELASPGLTVFERDALVRHGNIPSERVAQYALVQVDRDGMLERIVEKPDRKTLLSFSGPLLIGMNSWSLPPEIFDACRRITPSPRGELELQDAVQYARDRMGIGFRALVSQEGVLDLSTRGDVAAVAARLQGVIVRL